MHNILLGLIGYPLGHSRSPELFSGMFFREGITGSEYRLFPLQSISELPTLLKANPTLSGFNVTIPYKEAILPLLDELEETASSIGAVNTVTVTRIQGKVRLRGFNTDGPAFLDTLKNLQVRGPALILGSGGSSRAVAWALERAGIGFRKVSRSGAATGCLSYDDIDAGTIISHPLIVNTTPLGMYPLADAAAPIPYRHLTANHLLYDLVYNPGTTHFMHHGNLAGARTVNGLKMLQRQAELSFRIFFSAGG